jgi:hypothetical protein
LELYSSVRLISTEPHGLIGEIVVDGSYFYSAYRCYLTELVVYCLQSKLLRGRDMKKSIIIICFVGALLIILDSLNAANSLVLFLFVGVVPGTNLLISPVDMMAATATAITIIILRITVWSRIRTFLFAPSVHAKRTTKRAA